MINTKSKAHFCAIFTIIVWGTTLVSTKVLLHYGLRPAEIMLYRFIIAYIGMWVIYPHVHSFLGWREEFKFLIAGCCGGALYFVTENTALGITQASNVALIVSAAPLLTALMSHAFIKGERINKYILIGSAVALLGIALVVYNGSFILKINPLGDMLSLSAACAWAFYSIMLKKITNKYSTLFLTRKIFFYALISLIPVFIVEPLNWQPDVMMQWTVISNLLFLSIIASLMCYIMWGYAFKNLGVITVSSYMYYIPLVTMITSWVILNEAITVLSILGAGLILSGVYLGSKVSRPEIGLQDFKQK